MKKIIVLVLTGFLLFGCSQPKQEEVQPTSKEKEESVIEEEETQEQENIPEEKPVQQQPVEEGQTDPTADLNAQLNALIQEKNDLIAEKQNIGRNVRGPEKGEMMRDINLRISEIGRQIGEVKQQLGQ